MKMKKMLLGCGWAAILMLSWAGIGAGGDDAIETFRRGVAAYMAGDFERSVEAFEALAGQGIRNGKLFYNLGNAYLRQDRLGHALLW